MATAQRSSANPGASSSSGAYSAEELAAQVRQDEADEGAVRTLSVKKDEDCSPDF